MPTEPFLADTNAHNKYTNFFYFYFRCIRWMLENLRIFRLKTTTKFYMDVYASNERAKTENWLSISPVPHKWEHNFRLQLLYRYWIEQWLPVKIISHHTFVSLAEWVCVGLCCWFSYFFSFRTHSLMDPIVSVYGEAMRLAYAYLYIEWRAVRCMRMNMNEIDSVVYRNVLPAFI